MPRNFKLTMMMYWQDDGQSSYKPQTKHTGRFPLHSQNNTTGPRDYHTLIVQPTSALELLYAQYSIAFILPSPFSPFDYKMARAVVIVAMTRCHLRKHKGQKVQIGYCACTIYMQTHVVIVAFEVLTESFRFCHPVAHC